MTIRVLLVDDQEMVRTGLRLVIDRREDLSIVGEAADGSRPSRAPSRSGPTSC